jgi:Putative Actinobacterial Holin-X, holin superfamily III
MAVIQRIDFDKEPDRGGLGIQLARLAKLHAELALAEVRDLLVTAAVAVAVAVPAAIAIVAAIVMLIAAGFAPLFGARWEHLVIAGGGVLIVSCMAIGWSVWRLRHLRLPRETLRALTENWEWLVAQVRSRLTLR